MKNTPNPSRRKFIRTALQTSAVLPLTSGAVLAACNTTTQLAPIVKKEGPLKILILGGTSFLGPHQIAYALKRGHQITTFTRGKTKPTIHKELFDQVEQLTGDRENNLLALKGKQWDAVIDNSGRKVSWTKATADLLKDQVGLYVYVSSVSAYYPYYTVNVKEDAPLVMEVPAQLDEGEKPMYDYGVMKANSEAIARKIFGEDRTIAIRPHFMTGPADRTDRFMYWPLRLAKGGDIILPGKANDPVQFIDVRDIAEWMIRLIENGTTGTYNGAGPASPMTMPAYVYGAHAAFGSKVNFVSIDDYDFLEKNQVPFIAPWILPGEKFKGMSRVNIDKSVANGLTYRPLATTIKDVYDWWHSDAVTQERRDKLMNGEQGLFQREAMIIKEWNGR